MLELVVADSGPGVTDDMRERLFLPYFSTKGRGTGLGLTIAAKIMADHQGSIRAEQNTPSGARFLLELPLAPARRPDDGSRSCHRGRSRTREQPHPVLLMTRAEIRDVAGKHSA